MKLFVLMTRSCLVHKRRVPNQQITDTTGNNPPAWNGKPGLYRVLYAYYMYMVKIHLGQMKHLFSLLYRPPQARQAAVKRKPIIFYRVEHLELQGVVQ